MSFFSVWIRGLGLNMAVMTVIWVISVLITNVSIVDTYWFVKNTTAPHLISYPLKIESKKSHLRSARARATCAYRGLSFIVMSFAYDQYLGPSPRSSLMNALIYMWGTYKPATFPRTFFISPLKSLYFSG